ncbi:hypothetical protein SDC9_93458 [bioreactor metagenome]|uniref:Uncharacterized protein n=1 Tax=bioreactor metagenome TaxID=1076179 RepID=A0A645A136_9ZZZZ
MREVASTGEGPGVVGIPAIEVAACRIAAAPQQTDLAVPDEGACPHQERWADVLVFTPRTLGDRVAACRDHVGEGGLARASRADDCDQSGIQRNRFGGGPVGSLDVDPGYHLRGHGRLRWLGPDIGSVRRVDASLAQRFERQRALDPREPVFRRLRGGGKVVCIAAMHAWLATAIPILQMLRREVAQSKPEFALRRAAGEDEVCKLLNLLPNGLICRLAQA